jgi:two-component system, OmpR family, response regulator
MDLLLIEDDADLGQAVVDHLASAGHRVQWSRCLVEARDAAPWAMALLDLQLPDGDGLDLLRHWRGGGNTRPVIVLTARDDYLVKPFDLDKLLARVAAVARRMASNSAAGEPAGWLRSGTVQLDAAAHALWRDGERIDLTQMEWTVLACLARRPGRIYSRGEIEARLDELGLADAASNSLEVIVSRLRKKLGAQAISTHRGLGYRLEA